MSKPYTLTLAKRPRSDPKRPRSDRDREAMRSDDPPDEKMEKNKEKIK